MIIDQTGDAERMSDLPNHRFRPGVLRSTREHYLRTEEHDMQNMGSRAEHARRVKAVVRM